MNIFTAQLNDKKFALFIRKVNIISVYLQHINMAHIKCLNETVKHLHGRDERYLQLDHNLTHVEQRDDRRATTLFTSSIESKRKRLGEGSTQNKLPKKRHLSGMGLGWISGWGEV